MKKKENLNEKEIDRRKKRIRDLKSSRLTFTIKDKITEGQGYRREKKKKKERKISIS